MKKIEVSIYSHKSIMAAKSQLRKYKKELDNKARSVVSRLITLGIKTARVNCGEYRQVIAFSREIHGSGHNMDGRLIAVGQPVLRMRGGEMIAADPLLLAEFGSGFEAEVLDPVPGVGQGTFPGQTHAFDAEGWWYLSTDDWEYHHSYGEAPTHPMHAAMLAMIFDINRVLKEVYGNG